MRQCLRLCLVQMTSANNHADNIASVRAAAAFAAAEGCDAMALPEVAGLMNRHWQEAQSQVVTATEDSFIAACQSIAEQHRLWIQTGSTPVRSDEGRFLNHGNLINNSGEIVSEYNKIHLFDVFLEGKAPTGESKRYAPGTDAVLAATPWGGWGMSICYDLRFPHLYRQYSQAGATILFVPSAFTVSTGAAHWEVLLRARAIENGAWVVAAAQVGQHADGRQTYGHSLIVNPWGEVVTDMGGGAPGCAVVELDLAEVAGARQQIPSLQCDRQYGTQYIIPQ